MANCNICNKEIQEGYICVDCAKLQRQQAQKPTGTIPPAKPASSGFSLNTLLKPNTAPGNTPPPTRPATAPATSASNFSAPGKEPVVSREPAVSSFAPPLSTLPSIQDTVEPTHSSNFSADAEDDPDFPTSSPGLPSNDPVIPSTANNNSFSPAQIKPVLSRPVAPPPAERSSLSTPVARTSTAAIDIPIPSKYQEDEDKKQLEKEIFTSKVTGYGDEELEISVLAGIMKDSYILDILKGKGLMSGLFSTRYTRAIYQSILSLREESPELSGLDKIVLKNKLKQLNLYDASVQTQIDKIVAEPAPSIDQGLHYLELMKEQALKRKLKEVAHDISGFIDNPQQREGENIETFTNKIIQDVRNIQKARTTKRINLVKEEMRNIIGDIENREKVGEIDIIGYSFEPMHYLNLAVSGFRKGFMYAIAGAPRRGKTTFTLELATRVATLNKIPVLFFTYEQTKKNLTYRLLAKESRLNPDTLQRKKIRSDMIVDAKFMGGWKKMQDYMDYFYIIEATKEDTVDRIRSYAYNAMQDFNTDNIMIFIDYIQKMPLSRSYMDEKFKVEEISTELKGLSIELNNPIMTISSLSKEGCMIDATPDSERPTMYHCKGSGDLEYDLDCAMIQAKDWGDTRELYQQLQHKAEEMGKDTTRIPKVDVVNLYLDKNRDAPEGIFSTIQYLFFIEDNKFIELGPKFDDDRFRFSKIEELVDKLIEQNFIIFYDRPKDSSFNKGRVSIKLKNF